MLFGHFVVSGQSMEPSFSPGDKLLVSSLIYKIRKPKIGEVVILSHPRDRRLVLKRIVRITEAGYFVAGDNEKESTDSRNFGAIKKDKIIGKIIFRY